jgi:hypothetical protein
MDSSKKITCPFMTKLKPPELKPFLVPFYIMQGLLTLQSYLLLIKYQIGNPNPQKKTAKACNQLMDYLFAHP